MLAVLGALFANAVIAILKLMAALMTGSSGMMAEALHSIADTTNQVFLLRQRNIPSGMGKSAFSGLSLRRYSSSELGRLMRFTKAL